ncbi:MAG: ABC transporter permease [Proteobacteria bacterium]|nr:ABC transporter permease [Pseudomonadota bacterium]
MRFADAINLSRSGVFSQRLRSFLTALGIAVGISSVVLLTSIGEGIHQYVLSEFTQFGTNLIGINPGVTTTHGTPGAMISNVRPLTLEDALALNQIPEVMGMVPLVQGNSPVEYRGKTRRTYVFGVGHKVPEVWQMRVMGGRFLPDDDPRSARAFVVLGSRVRQELFGTRNPLGKRVRIGGERYRVIGLMESKGQMLGFDLDDAVYIPVARALAMFNRESLMEIDILYGKGISADQVVKKIKNSLIRRHGTQDFTITTQEQMIEVLGSVLNILTLAVGALGGISLFVGGIGILTIMTIAVQERTAEIGLLRALGAGQGQILLLFMGEAITLSALGGFAGLALGWGGAWLLGLAIPALPTHTPLIYVVLAELLAIFIGLLSGVVPAFRAAGLDPVEALRSE